jgi:cysteinyl-tRNA synthetase
MSCSPRKLAGISPTETLAMPFTLYDTRQRSLVPFEPRREGVVSIYNCGPTVYSTSHIGNFRSFLFTDLLRRYFEWRGYEVTQIMNITDVGHLTEDQRTDATGEDKLQKKARDLGWDPYRVARHFEDQFHVDRKALNIQDAHRYPRATDHICDMLVQIQQLLDGGHAYIPDGTGEVYYDIASFPEYGKLSGKTLEDLRAGARVEINDKKRHPADFALWKVDSAHLMQWDPHADQVWSGYDGGRPLIDSRIGKGFPGWHIECSAMSARYLGNEFDLHTGGEDNIFPHHECEIAQAEGATHCGFARHWMHTRFLLVDGAKMSKSTGSLLTLDDIRTRGYTPTELRYLLITNHYRQQLNFTNDGLVAARASLARLQKARTQLAARAESAPPDSKPTSTVAERIELFERDYGKALDDDLNVSNAMAAMFAFVSDIHRLDPSASDAVHLLRTLDRADHVLGVLSRDVGRTGWISREELTSAEASGRDPSELESWFAEGMSVPALRALAQIRHAARSKKDYKTADAIRDHLKKSGVVFEDTPDGVRYRLP